MGAERYSMVKRLGALICEDERGFQLIEFVLVLNLFLVCLVVGMMYSEWAEVKGINELAAREAGRYYAVHISEDDAEAGKVLTDARNVAAQNVKQFLHAQKPWFDEMVDVKIEPIAIAGAKYYSTSVVVHVPVHAPYVNRLLGRPLPGASDAAIKAWDQPIGEPFNNVYVFNVTGHSIFRGET